MNPTRAALIGCGSMGSGHARLALDLGVELVAFCDNVAAAAHSLQEKMNVGSVVSEPAAIMADDSIDLVIIATHHDAHYPLALAAATAGKHLLVEKPLCLEFEQALEVADAVDKAGVKLVVNCKFRIYPAVQKIRELLPAPRLSHGQLAMAATGIGRPGAHWIWDPDDGGGLLISTAIHTIDLLTYLMDSTADRVYAEGRVFGSHKGDSGFPDGLVGTIAWKSGALSTVISTDQGFSPTLSKWFNHFCDGERTATLTEHTARVDFGGCDIDYVDGRESSTDQRREATMLANLLETIRTDGDTLCDARAGAHSVAICNALSEAVRTGKPVDVRQEA